MIFVAKNFRSVFLNDNHTSGCRLENFLHILVNLKVKNCNGFHFTFPRNSSFGINRRLEQVLKFAILFHWTSFMIVCVQSQFMIDLLVTVS